MKGTFLKFILFFLVCTYSYAQRDLIVTQSGENIRCKIIHESHNSFTYIYLGPEKKLIENSIFKSLITSFKYNYYAEDLIEIKSKKEKSNKKRFRFASKNEKEQQSSLREVVKSSETEGRKDSLGNIIVESPKVKHLKRSRFVAVAEKKSSVNSTIRRLYIENDTTIIDSLRKFALKNYLKYRVGFRLGMGDIGGQVGNGQDYNYYFPNLKYGFIYGIDGLYFPKKNIGFGLNYNEFISRASSSKVDYADLVLKTNVTGGTLSEKVTSKFIGPTIAYRRKIGKNSYLVAALSPGIAIYDARGKSNANNYHFTGNTFGTTATIAYDYLIGNDKIGRDIILSFEAGIMYAQLSKLNYGMGNVDLAGPLKMSRADISIGLRFLRFPFKFR